MSEQQQKNPTVFMFSRPDILKAAAVVNASAPNYRYLDYEDFWHDKTRLEPDTGRLVASDGVMLLVVNNAFTVHNNSDTIDKPQPVHVHIPNSFKTRGRRKQYPAKITFEPDKTILTVNKTDQLVTSYSDTAFPEYETFLTDAGPYSGYCTSHVAFDFKRVLPVLEALHEEAHLWSWRMSTERMFELVIPIEHHVELYGVRLMIVSYLPSPKFGEVSHIIVPVSEVSHLAELELV